jgi:hypothetical protein
MVSTIIRFNKTDVQPPVFVAGTFTEWSPMEMSHSTTESAGSLQNRYAYSTDLSPGQHQYKFRLGPGDWWVTDDTTPSGTDDAGNVNNIITIEPEENATTESLREPSPVTRTPGSLEEGTTSAMLVETQSQLESQSEAENGSGQPKTDQVNSHVEGNKEDPIPDIAPPPYSVAQNDAELTPSSLKSDSPKMESLVSRTNGGIAAIEGIGKGESTTPPRPTGVSARNVALVITLVVIPLAVSYLWRR